jgi:hypothetical protein
MRRLSLVSALLLLLPLALAGEAGAQTRDCGSIAFSVGTEEGVSEIRARNVSCRTARSVARRARGRGPSGEPGTVFRYRHRHFRCTGREADTPLPSVRYRCVRGRAVVRFVKT